ncbi:MAG TPA: hypothetical protein VGK03_11050 [Geothrix sp.]|jgi:hypothetical protein
MQFVEFINLLYGDIRAILAMSTDFALTFWLKQTKGHRSFTQNDFDQALPWITQEVGCHRDVYYTVSIQNQALNKATEQSRSKEAAAAIPGVWADIDCKDATGAHKTNDLPTQEEALAFLNGLPLPPSLVVATGHGFHPYWILNQPRVFTGDSDRQEAADLVLGFQTRLRSLMTAKGWKLDATHEFARVLRIPGTKNFKSAPVLEVKVQQHVPERRYTWAELQAQTQPQELKGKKKGDNPKKNEKNRPPASSATSMEAVKRCLFLTYAKTDAASLSEPLWWAMVSVLAHAGDGAALIHSLSEPYPGYSREETDNKIQNALAADGPMTCAKISELTGAEFCRGCPYLDKVATPLQLGTKAWGHGKDPLLLSNDLDEEVKAALSALVKVEEVYHRAGRLVRVMPNQLAAQPGQPSPLEIQPLNASALKVLLSKHKRFLRATQQGVRPVYPPDPLINGLLEYGIYANVRHLKGVTQVPILCVEGSILQKPGYDLHSELLYQPLAEFPPVPETPTESEVADAVALLLEVVVDFPFADAVGQAVFVAAILTHLGRHAFRGPVPMILVTANIPGAGKTKVADAISLITTGMNLPRSTQTKVEEEERKRITAMLMKGGRYYLIDNVGSRLGGPVLDALLTSEVWQDRVLGRSQDISLPNHLQVIATGNNLELQADTIRRCLQIQILCNEEHPEARSDFRHPDLEGWIIENQPALLVAALTLLRGYFAAGRPPQELVTLGSYGGWSRLIQATVKWALGMDPGLARVPVGEGSDLNTDLLHLLMSGWSEVAPTKEHLTCRKVMELIHPGTRGQAILDAIELAFPGKRQSPTELGSLLRKFRKRVHEGAYFDHDTGKSAAGRRWQLVTCDTRIDPLLGDDRAERDGDSGRF